MVKIQDKIIETRVDKDILDFLKAAYFGDYSNVLKAASGRAYRDMNRTIRFNGLPDKKRLEMREKVNSVLEEEIKRLTVESITNQETFDAWHYNVSDKIKSIYVDAGIKFTYGHAQKWINMTIKYLYMLGVNSFEDVFEYLHIPLDNYVFDVAKTELNIPRPKTAWSSWDDYDGLYLNYQKLIRQKMDCVTPLRWEFRYWLKAARNMNVNKE